MKISAKLRSFLLTCKRHGQFFVELNQDHEKASDVRCPECKA